MEEKQAILANVLRKVLAKDRSILARREDLIAAMGILVPVAAMREYRALKRRFRKATSARYCSQPIRSLQRSGRRHWGRSGRCSWRRICRKRRWSASLPR